MANANVTAAHLRELFTYEPETGNFIWRVQRGKMTPGKAAGCLATYGYWGIKVGPRKYLAHRLAVLWMTGAFPPEDVDHINGNRIDNRWENLRLVSRAINLQNKRKPHSNNKSGLLGVQRANGDGRWRARLQINGRAVQLGCHDTPEAAHAAYVAGKRKYHEGCTL